MTDSVKVLANPSVSDGLIKFRKLLTKYFNVKDGDELGLIIVTNSEANAKKLNEVISDNNLVKSIEKEFKVKVETNCIGKELNVKFNPDGYVFNSDNVKLTLNEFLYVTKDLKKLNSFLTEYNLDETSEISLGCSSLQALIKFCSALKMYKNKFFVCSRSTF